MRPPPLTPEEREEMLDYCAESMGITREELKRQFLKAVMEMAVKREPHGAQRN